MPGPPGDSGNGPKPDTDARSEQGFNGGPERRHSGPDFFVPPPPPIKSFRLPDGGRALQWHDRLFSVTPPLADERVAAAEARLGVRLPEDYLDVVRSHQGGSPDQNTVTLPDGGQTSLDLLLHFEDAEPTYNLVRIVQDSDAVYGKLIPFAVDSDRNYFCFDYRGETNHSSAESRWNRPVVLVAADSPQAEPQPVAGGFSELLDALRGVVTTSR